MKLKELIDVFEDYAPPALAQDKDPIGLHFGRMDQPIHKVLVTLDVRPEVVDEAIEKKVDFIFAHHPPIFRPIRSFDYAVPQNQMYAKLIKADLAVYAAHTNLDATQDGMNDWLAHALDLEDVEIMSVNGQYHGKDYGYGRVGNLKKELSFKACLDYIQSTFKLEGLRYVGKNWNKKINRLAIMGGSGGSLYTQALAKDCDLYITGDLSYHTAHDIEESGLLAIDAGHHIEEICVPHLVQLFNQWKMDYQWPIEVIASQVNTEPFYFY